MTVLVTSKNTPATNFERKFGSDPQAAIQKIFNTCSYKFLKTVWDSPGFVTTDKELNTSCIANATAVASALWGLEHTTKFLKMIKRKWSVNWSFTGPKGGTFNFKIDLIGGLTTYYLNKGLSEADMIHKVRARSEALLIPHFMLLFPHRLDDEEKAFRIFKERLNATGTNYHKLVLEKLQKTIRKNANHLDKPYAYWISMVDHKEVPARIEHSFVITQYLNQNEVRYRIYQSYVSLYTLSEYLADSKELSGEELQTFLKHLDNLFVKSENNQSEYERCFQGNENSQTHCLRDARLTGIDLRFICKPFENSVRTLEDLFAPTYQKIHLHSMQLQSNCVSTRDCIKKLFASPTPLIKGSLKQVEVDYCTNDDLISSPESTSLGLATIFWGIAKTRTLIASSFTGAPIALNDLLLKIDKNNPFLSPILSYAYWIVEGDKSIILTQELDGIRIYQSEFDKYSLLEYMDRFPGILTLTQLKELLPETLTCLCYPFNPQNIMKNAASILEETE